MKHGNYFPFICITTLVYLVFLSSQRGTLFIEKKQFQSGNQSIELRFVKTVKKTKSAPIFTAKPITEKPLKKYKSKQKNKISNKAADKKILSKAPPKTSTKKALDILEQPSPPSLKSKGVLQQAIVKNGSKPSYPKLAILRGEEGVVLVKLTVTTKGMGINPRILRSSGSSLLDNSILNFIKEELFIPDQQEDKPISSDKVFSFKFELH